jgi:hypothetical protein
LKCLARSNAIQWDGLRKQSIKNEDESMIKHQLTVANALIVIKHPEKKRGNIHNNIHMHKGFRAQSSKLLAVLKDFERREPSE